jgi:hypothetical protein
MNLTVEQLHDFLDSLDIPREAYSVNGHLDDAYCITSAGDEWLIYYSERGSRDELAWAKSYSQALNILRLFVMNGFGRFAVGASSKSP